MSAIRHDVHSHAHEGSIPGTVDLKAKDGEETHYGQALFPVPSKDPNDPLQWPRWKKNTILAICSLYSFLGNSALLGPSTYIGIYVEAFGIGPNQAAGLINYPNLAFGFGSLLLVPLYQKLGRRPVMLFSLVAYSAGLIGASQATTFNGLMAARVVHGFGSGICEAIPVQLVNDIFFLHERGQKLGWYTAALCLGASGPMWSGFMLAGGYSWRLFFYVEFAFAVALLVAAFIFVEESAYKRKLAQPHSPTTTTDEKNGTEISQVESISTSRIPPRKSFGQQLSIWNGIDADAPFFSTMLRSFTYLLVPSMFWVITTYGLFIGLCALTFNFIFPLKIVQPPYNWSQTNSGLISIGTILGYFLALPFLSTSDKLAAYLTRKNNGIREAEMRLGVLIPALFVAPAGLILFGMTAARDLHWLGFFFGVGLVQWAAYFYFTITLAYAVDSYTANLSEFLIIANLGKQAVSFGLGLEVLNWILAHGYLKIIVGAFTATLLVNNIAVVPFMLFGKKIRIFIAGSWLARMHAKTANKNESH